MPIAKVDQRLLVDQKRVLAKERIGHIAQRPQCTARGQQGALQFVDAGDLPVSRLCNDIILQFLGLLPIGFEDRKEGIYGGVDQP